MATLWIREFRKVGKAPKSASESQGIPVAQEPGTDQTPVTYTTSAQSSVFANSTRYIVITSSAAFHYVTGSNPTATTNHLRVPADQLWCIGVTPGDKLAVIAAA